MLQQLKHIHARRTDLRRHIDIEAAFEAWEETCVPSYCPANLLAAYVSWFRLFRAIALARRNRPDATRVLDFGSSVGELGQLLDRPGMAYDFIEQDEEAARYLLSHFPGAVRRSLDDAPEGDYDWVYAIDSLEHNEDYADLLDRLAAKLAPSGIMVLSGPTENRLYRLGRAVAGFNSHYHMTTIYQIETAAARTLVKLDGATILPGLPLFRLSVWSRN